MRSAQGLTVATKNRTRTSVWLGSSASRRRKTHRVAVALWDAQFSFWALSWEDQQPYRNEVCDLLCEYFVRGTRFHQQDPDGGGFFEVGKWWDANEADLRHRANRPAPTPWQK